MKEWMARRRLDAALASGRDLTPFWRRVVEHSPRLRDYERRIRDLDRTLRTAESDEAEVPPELHSAILRAVREARRAAVEPVEAAGLGLGIPLRRWVWSVSLVSVLLVGGIWSGARWANSRVSTGEWMVVGGGEFREDPPALPSAGTLLADLGEYGPNRLHDPLSAELGVLSHDVREAAEFLVNSLP